MAMVSIRRRTLLLLSLAFGTLPGCQPTRDYLFDLRQYVINHLASDKSIIVAQVDGTPIVVDEFRTYWRTGPWRNLPLVPPRTVLQALIRQKILVMAAKKSGLDRDLGVRAAQERALANAEFNREYEEAARHPAAQEEVLEYYRANGKVLADPTLPKYRQILLKSPADAARALRLLKQGRSFDTVAQSLSIDKSGKGKGGETDPNMINLWGPEFTRTVEALREGEISVPIKTQAGYHLILKEPIAVPPFTEVESEIRTQLARAKVKQYLDEATAKTPIHINEKLLESLGSPSSAEPSK